MEFRISNFFCLYTLQIKIESKKTLRLLGYFRFNYYYFANMVILEIYEFILLKKHKIKNMCFWDQKMQYFLFLNSYLFFLSRVLYHFSHEICSFLKKIFSLCGCVVLLEYFNQIGFCDLIMLEPFHFNKTTNIASMWIVCPVPLEWSMCYLWWKWWVIRWANCLFYLIHSIFDFPFLLTNHFFFVVVEFSIFIDCKNMRSISFECFLNEI